MLTDSGRPSRAAATGFARFALRIASVRSAAAVGTSIASRASTSSSSATCSRQARNASAPTAPVVSTGPETADRDGNSRVSSSWVAVPRVATISPLSTHASAASAPAPPALDTIATRRPAGSGCAARNAAASTSSPRLCVAMMPAWPNSASCVTRRGPDAAVCDSAARRPAADRPPTTVSTGILWPTRRAVRANPRGFPYDSRYKMASLVCSSCSHQVSMSLLDTSYLSPTEANDETPTPSRPRRTPGKARVQRVRGHRDAIAVGADEPHAVPAADREQVSARIAESRGNDRERAHASLPALLGHGGDLRGRHGDDGHVDVRGQFGRRAEGGHPLDVAAPAVDRVNLPAVAARHDVVQDLPADRAALPPGAYDRDGAGPQERPQARDVCSAGAVGHLVEIAVELLSLRAGQRHRELNDAAGELPAHLEARLS